MAFCTHTSYDQYANTQLYTLTLQLAPNEGEETDDVPVGPGGLHPSDVMASLPESMQKAFEARDIGALQVRSECFLFCVLLVHCR
jgi:hypothetical protein